MPQISCVLKYIDSDIFSQPQATDGIVAMYVLAFRACINSLRTNEHSAKVSFTLKDEYNLGCLSMAAICLTHGLSTALCSFSRAYLPLQLVICIAVGKYLCEFGS